MELFNFAPIGNDNCGVSHHSFLLHLSTIAAIAVKGTQRAGQVDLSLRAGSSEAGGKKTFLNHHTSMSLIDSLLDTQRPTFLFGCTPPSSTLAPAKVNSICKKFVERGRVLAVDGFIVYDVQDESSRTLDKRPFPFRNLHDSSWYAGLVTSESGKSCVVYKAAPCDPDFDRWLADSVEKDGHNALTVVGAPSSTGSNPGPSTKVACQRVAKYEGVHFGCVCIAERHLKHRCEHEILIKKMQWGAEWFITQGIYDPNPMISVIKDYSRKCREMKLKPKKIILTFTPCGRRKTMSFIKWLGMRVPEDVERRIFGSLETDLVVGTNKETDAEAEAAGAKAEANVEAKTEAKEKDITNTHTNMNNSPITTKKKKNKKVKRPKTPVEISSDIMCENLRAILDATSTCGVPLGINVESVSGYRDEIDATHDLFRSLQTIMLNHSGEPWVVRWHALDVSERRRGHKLRNIDRNGSGSNSSSSRSGGGSGSGSGGGSGSGSGSRDGDGGDVVDNTNTTTWSWTQRLLVACGVCTLGMATYAAANDTGATIATRMRDNTMALAIGALCFTQAAK